MNGIPLDAGPYVVLITIVILLVAGFAAAVKWLDARDKARSASFESRIGALEKQLELMQGRQKMSVVFVAQSLALLSPDQSNIADLLIKAMSALEGAQPL